MLARSFLIGFLILIGFKIKSITNIKCECSLHDLEEQEKLNKEIYRIRIEHPNGLNKYEINEYTYFSSFECDSVALYEVDTSISKNQTISNKQCKKCTINGWSYLLNCETDIKCDRDALIGQPTLHLANLEPPPIDQKLFKPGQVVVVYKYLNYKVCRLCQFNGEWSKYPEQDYCKKVHSLRSFVSCSSDDLTVSEQQQPDYMRLRIESSNGMKKLEQKSLRSSQFYPDGSVVLYHTYLANFAQLVPKISQAGFSQLVASNFNPSSSFVKKNCRYCTNGVWSDLESCVSLSCDRTEIKGSPDFIMLTTNLKPSDDQILFKPGTVVATFTFGNSLYCKQCQENGEWSRFPLAELCPNTSYFKYLDRVQMKKPLLRYRNINEDYILNDETPCNLDSLLTIETNLAAQNSSLNYTRLYLVSDNKQKLNPFQNAKIPSRSLSIYEVNYSRLKKNYCSICLNGAWTKITEKCSENTNINFCERSKLTYNNGKVLKIIDTHGNKVPDSQEIFEPNSVRAVYVLSETTRLCKMCEEKNNSSSADWSRYAETRLCNLPLILENKPRIRKFTNSCQIIDLESDNHNNTEYTKETILSWNAKRYLNDDSLSTFVEDLSMATFKSKSSSSLFCRRCSNGKWANYTVCPIEFTIKKCDPFLIRGANYFVNKFTGLKLSDSEKNDLVMPGNVIAVYEFGSQNRFCKECAQNGTWSRFPTIEMCRNLQF